MGNLISFIGSFFMREIEPEPEPEPSNINSELASTDVIDDSSRFQFSSAYLSFENQFQRNNPHLSSLEMGQAICEAWAKLRQPVGEESQKE